jgi:hypothetical protein
MFDNVAKRDDIVTIPKILQNLKPSESHRQASRCGGTHRRSVEIQPFHLPASLLCECKEAAIAATDVK